MILGQTLLAAKNDTKTYYTPWFPRGGNSAEFSCEIFEYSENCTVNVTVQTKNSEDNDSTAEEMAAQQIISSSPVPTLPHIVTWEPENTGGGTWAGAKELVRFKIQVIGDNVSSDDGFWAHLRMLAPSWVTN
jgi:hypothetical protein